MNFQDPGVELELPKNTEGGSPREDTSMIHERINFNIVIS